MDLLEQLGIGIAIGMLAGTTGTHGSARGRMTVLAAVIGLIVGFLLDSPAGAVACLVGAAFACVVASDIVAGASRRQGSTAGALGFLIAFAALLVPAAVIVIVIALAWLAFTRYRRAQRKHAGLRILR